MPIFWDDALIFWMKRCKVSPNYIDISVIYPLPEERVNRWDFCDKHLFEDTNIEVKMGMILNMLKERRFLPFL